MTHDESLPPPDSPSPDRAAAPAAADAASQRRRGRLRLWLAGTLGAVLLLLALAGGSAWWALRSERGTAWLLARLPGLEVVAPRGTLIGDFGAESIVWRFGTGGLLRLENVAWQGLGVYRSSAAGAWALVWFDRLQASAARLTLPEPAQDNKSPPPTELVLPVELVVRALQVDAVHAAALGDEPLRGLSAGLHLGAERGTRHDISALALARGPLQAQGDLRVGARAPMQADVRLALSQPAMAQRPAWRADLQLTGPLAASTLKARLTAQAAVQARSQSQPQSQAPSQPAPAAAPQTLDIDAIVQPFAEWPLKQLQARAQRLDVSALLPGAPRTALTGRIDMADADAEKPLAAQIDLANERPGGWDSGALPLRRIVAELATAARDRSSAQLRQFDIELGAEQPAGHLRGSGNWSADNQAALQLQLDGVRPDRVDGRATPLLLNGTLALQWDGRKPARAQAPAAAASASQRVALSADLRGTPLAGAVRSELRLQAAGDARWADAGPLNARLERLDAAQGRSSASASGTLRRAAPTAPWQAAGKASVASFDPRPWLPSLRNAPRSAGGDQLTGAATFDVTLPPPAAAASAPSTTPQPASGLLPPMLAGLRGQADLTLAPSRLAGVPVQGNASLRAPAGGDALDVTARIDAAGNRVDASLRTGANAARDQASAQIDAPALQRLQPLLRAVGFTGAAPAGAVRADAAAEGRWPNVTTRGTLRADGLAWQDLRLQHADARWRIGTQAGAPTELSGRLTQLTVGASTAVRQVPSLDLALTGTAAAHRLVLATDIAAAPPAWLDTVQPGTAQPQGNRGPATGGPRTRVQLQAEGALAHTGTTVAGWRGRLLALDVARPEGPTPLLRTAGPVGVAWRAATAAQTTRVQVDPGRADVLGSALRWQQLAWQDGRGNAPAQIEVDATLDAVAVAPLLARLQPELGWAGDLRVSARAVALTAPALRAELTLQRSGGDLQMQQAAGARRALGLSALTLAVRANGPAWTANARVAATSVGTATADITTRAAPDSLLPNAASPLQGSAKLAVADLAIYGPWLQVGWRIGGELDADVRLSGSIGAPQYLGTLRGRRLAFSDFLQGIAIRDGELQATLDGERGRIDRFVARAGDGTLRASGEARFGAAPTAQLQLVAERFRVLARSDRQVDVSGDARVRLEPQRIALNGRFAIDEGLIDLGRGEAPELSSDVRVVDGPTPGRPEPKKPAGGKAAATKPQRAVEMDLRVDLGSKLRVRGKGINTLLAGDLRVTAPGGELEIDGTVRTVQGSYEAYGEKLSIERGLITFVGPLANPRLDVQAMRPDLREVEVGVAITGTVQNPRVRLVSTPEMSELDKLSWLTLGRASTGLASDQSAILQRAALALLADRRGSAGGEGIAKRLGLDNISVGRGASGGLSDAVVSLGKQVSERFYVGYTQSLDATGGGFELIYKIARRFTLRVQTGEATAVDLIWTWIWG